MKTRRQWSAGYLAGLAVAGALLGATTPTSAQETIVVSYYQLTTETVPSNFQSRQAAAEQLLRLRDRDSKVLWVFTNQLVGNIMPGTQRLSSSSRSHRDAYRVSAAFDSTALTLLSEGATAIGDSLFGEFLFNRIGGAPLRVIAGVMRQGEGAEADSERAVQAEVLRNYIATTDTVATIVMGCFGPMGPTGSAWEWLTAESPRGTPRGGRLVDPTGAVGPWNNDSAYALLHTYCATIDTTRPPDERGLRSRQSFALFDSRLAANDLVDSSYQALMNQGITFGKAVNGVVHSPTHNLAAEASDHLAIRFLLKPGQASGVRREGRHLRHGGMRLSTNRSEQPEE